MSKEVFLKFGKHSGELLSEIPFSYFCWLLLNYKGGSLNKKDLEQEAIKRGLEKRNGKWGKETTRVRITGGFDVNDVGFGTMYGVTRHLKDGGNYILEDQFDDEYDYEGIPNFT